MLEMITLAPLVSVTLAVVGIVAGLIVGHFALPAARRGRRLQTALDELQREHETYRHQVTAHFEKTAVLIGDLTASYKAVYDHLASGARDLAQPALAGPVFQTRLIVDGSTDRGGADLPEEPFAREHGRAAASAATPVPRAADAVAGSAITASAPAAAVPEPKPATTTWPPGEPASVAPPPPGSGEAWSGSAGSSPGAVASDPPLEASRGAGGQRPV